MAKKKTTRRKSTRRTTRSAPATGAQRTERDSMGAMPVPAHVLYGASTQRAVLNFPVSGRPVPPDVIVAFARLKQAAAESNQELGLLPAKQSRLIVGACKAILDAAKGPKDPAANPLTEHGPWMDHFPVDVYQTGSGTSTNMNVNEVVSNLACVKAGTGIGAKDPVHPNDHVNMGQSSNDTFPTAMQVAACTAIRERLRPAIDRLRRSLGKKATAWDDVVKTGRTHLMDATPIRLGQEFAGYAAQMAKALERADAASAAMAGNLPIGGTAVGTGINTHPRFARLVCQRLSKATGVRFAEAPDHCEAQATRDCVVEASGQLRTIAVSLSKIANDIRWLGSGPRCGLFELALPATQPGSSIMPGKVNPVICESVMMVACQVAGHDAAIAMGGAGGVGSLLELNVAMPMMGWSLIDEIDLLAGACTILAEKCVDGLEVNRAIAEGTVERSLMTCTALAPVIGYDVAAKVAKDAFASGRTVREQVLADGLLDAKRLDDLLDARAMTEPLAATRKTRARR